MGQAEFNSLPLAAFKWIIPILFSIGSGILAWNWVGAESFWGTLGFIIVCGIFSKVGYIVISILFNSLFRKV